MIGHFSSLQRVEPRQIYRLAGARDAIIRVRSGMLWLTEQGAPEDYFLSGEQTYRIRCRGVVLIESADMNTIEFEIDRPLHALVARLASLAASGVRPVQRLNARWNALGSEKPSK